jgi:adenylosuccinate lyase
MIDRYANKDITKIFNRKWEYMLEVEKAAATAQQKLNIIPEEACKQIQTLKVNEERILEIEKETHHDVEAFVRSLAEQIPEGKYVHYKCTSSDILDSAMSMMIADSMFIIFKKISRYEKELEKKKSLVNINIIGRTHGMPAQLMTLAHKFEGYYQALLRDIKKLTAANEQLCKVKLSGPVGNYSLLPARVEKHVGVLCFLNTEEHATQVIPRDKHSYLIYSLASLTSNIERLALEIRLLHRPEVSELKESFKKDQVGSSAMPHKKNPIKCEQICGLNRMMKSFVVAAMDDISLWHERDMSHSSVERFIIPQALNIACYILESMSEILFWLEIDEKSINDNIEKYKQQLSSAESFIEAIDSSNTREEAYSKIQKNYI